MLRKSSPIQLQQLDISPALQAGALEQQGIAQVASGLQTAILEFSQKQQEKKIKRERDAQIDAFLPSLLESTGLDIEVGTPEYNAFSQYLKKTSGDDILSGIKQIQEIAPAFTPTPSLQTVTSPGGAQVFTFDGEVIDPSKVIDPNAPSAQALGFEPEFPLSYLVPFDDAGTPDDPSDDTPATRVQVTTVSKDPGGLTYDDGSLVAGGDQVYTDPKTGGLKKLDPTTMFPMTEGGVKNLQGRMDDDLKIHLEVQEALPKLQQYIDNRGQMSKAGAQRIFNQINAGLKAFSGDTLNPTEMATAKAKAQFRQLLGTLRLDILGPGVLTEFDRKVIEEAIGGFGPFTTNEMAIDIIQNIANQKLQKGRIAAQRYNRSLNKAGPGTQYFYDPIDMSIYDVKPVFDPTRDLANDFGSIDEAEAFAKENDGKVFIFNGKKFGVE
jgi:hypothetical protein